MKYKKQILLLLLLITIFKVSAQKNIYHFTSKDNNTIRNVISNGNSIFIGGTFEDSAIFNSYTFKSLALSNNTMSGKSGDIFVAKLDSVRNIQWAKVFGGNDYSVFNKLILDKSENLLFTFDYQKTFIIGNDTLGGFKAINSGIVKLDKNGEKIWAKSISSNKKIEQRYLTIDDDNNIYITANCSDTIFIDGNPYFEKFISSVFIKIDAKGNIVWVKIFNNNENGEFIVATSISVLPSGEIILVGNSSKNAANFDGKQILAEDSNYRFFVIKMKNDNTILWMNTATGSTGAGAGRFMEIGKNGDIFITGVIYGNLKIENKIIQGLDKPPYSDLFLAKYTNEGKLAWIKIIGSNTGNADLVYGLKYRNNEKLYLAATYMKNYQLGDTTLNPLGKTDGYLAEFDTNGTLIRFISTKGENELCISTIQDFDFDQNRNAIIVGSFNFIVDLENEKLNTTGGTDAFLWITNNWTTTSNVNEARSNFFDFRFNIFPNPCSQFININFSVDRPENIKFELIDLSGRTLFLKNKTAFSFGSYQEMFELKNLKPGCYFIKATTDKVIQSKKLIVAGN